MKKGHTSFPVKSLATITEELHHEWVDVMKLDIEGTEWGVLKDLVAKKAPLPFTQLQVCTKSFLVSGNPLHTTSSNGAMVALLLGSIVQLHGATMQSCPTTFNPFRRDSCD